MSDALVVEDESAVRQLVIEMLESLGFNVVSEQTAEQGWRTFAERPERWQLVVSDFLTPGMMTGSDLAREVIKLRPDCPVLISSGYIDTLEVKLSDKLRLIHKPWSVDFLEVTVRGLCGMA